MMSQVNSSRVEKVKLLAQQITDLTAEIQANPDALASNPTENAKLFEAATKLIELEWNVFENIPVKGAVTYEDLAKSVSADTELIVRFSRILVAKGTLRPVGANSISHTDASLIFKAPSPLIALVKHGFDDHFASLMSMLPYFRQYGLAEPVGLYNTINAFALGDPNLTVWEHMNRNPEKMKNFMVAMEVMSKQLPTTGSYDYSWVIDDKYSDRTLVVDVGGGKGHALDAIVKATPGLPMERCAVEDLDVVVTEAKAIAQGALSHAQFVTADFHKEQPIKNALIYYIRRCLHDYGDADAIGILKQQQQAMAEDSRVLVVEQILAEPPLAVAATTDIIMATGGGKERTENGFHYIANQAGLQIVNFHRSEGTDVAVIECMRAS